ncbi:MAG: ATP-binding protein [Pseudomonadota bacterium]
MNSSPPDPEGSGGAATRERRSLSIRAQILLGLAALLVPLLFVGWTTSYSQSFTAAAIADLAGVNAKATLSHELAASVMALERSVLLYRQTGNEQSAQRTLASYPRLLAELDALRQSEPDPDKRGLLERMRRHIEDHEANFAEVVSERQRREQLVQDALMTTTALIRERLDGLAGSVSDPAELRRIDRLRSAFAQAHAAALRFLNTPDFVLVEQVTGHLDAARQYSGGAASPPVSSRYDAIEALLSRYENGFLSIAQATRGYLFLSNVVMAGSSDEYIRLSGELTELTNRRAATLNDEVNAKFATVQRVSLVVLLLSLGIAAAVALQFGGRLSARIAEITDVFNRLASGEKVESIPGTDRGDELGRLAAAANVFHSTNERTKHLLAEARRLADVQKRTNDELAQQVRERQSAERRLKARSDDLERSNKDLAQFAYVASHDLQEPLRMVTSYVQLLADEYGDKLDESGHEFVGYAVDGAQRMKHLITSLLEYSRVGTRGGEPEPVDVADALRAALKNLEVSIESAGATINPGQLPEVHADPTQLVQLLQNLIGNAIKFAGDAPPVVDIDVEADDETYHFRVSDNGIGFDPQYSQRIFTIFQRLNGREDFPGTGIGLTVCKKIVERHGGEIWAESEPGKGTTIHFTLPVDPLTRSGLQPRLDIAS